jgi:Kef-type K+ transport system membrane component KefB
MNARGLMELIVLKVGLDIGVIGPKLFTMLLIMAILTTLMASPLLSLFGRGTTDAADGVRS